MLASETTHSNSAPRTAASALMRPAAVYDSNSQVLADAVRELGGVPHFWGIVERVIGTLMQLVHALPGTTFANPVARGGYDRIVCSTEGPMGLVALFLKHAFEVPAWFFVHTDWMDFARTNLAWDRAAMSRLRRILRAFYHSYDGLFVLNAQMRDWFSGSLRWLTRIFSASVRPRPRRRRPMATRSRSWP